MSITIFILGFALIFAVAPIQIAICKKNIKDILKFLLSIILPVISVITLILTLFATDWDGLVYFIIHLWTSAMLISDCIGWTIFAFLSKENENNKKLKRCVLTLIIGTIVLIIGGVIVVSIASA